VQREALTAAIEFMFDGGGPHRFIANLTVADQSG